MPEDRRRDIAPEILLAIHDAVGQAFEANAHRCLVGFSESDREGLLEFKNLLHDYPPAKLRESFNLVKTLLKVRNTAGNIFVFMIFSGIFAWMMSKLFPGISWK